MMKYPLVGVAVAVFMLVSAGCQEWFLNRADLEVTRLIRQRQEAALGITSDFSLPPEDGRSNKSTDMYSFVPRPVDTRIPDEFKTARIIEEEELSKLSAEQIRQLGDEGIGPTAVPKDRVFTLPDALGYAQRHARDFQTEKEDLYLSALALSLERFLWTPQFMSEVSFEYANYGQIRDFDRAMTAVADFAVTQRLPYGGTVTAQVIASVMRDLGVHTTSGEGADVILAADIPLLRGAGRVAYESRYQAERDLIYSVRVFERFRRSFLVDVASDFFNLLSQKARIEAAFLSENSFLDDLKREEAFAEIDPSKQIDADRARVEFLQARNERIVAEADFQTNLDLFKIRIGMPTTEPLDVADSELGLFEPQIDEEQAVAAGQQYRLDLLNTRDFIDDARRGVLIAKNNMLPDFDVSGSVTNSTDPGHLSTTGFNTERTTWRGGVSLEIPLNRRAERNDLRASIIGLRRAERNLDQALDTVRVEIRRSIRRVEQSRVTLRIQEEQIRTNQFRVEKARTELRLGTLPSNRDVVEAENDLRRARNELADAESDYRRAILEFLRDTGMLRIEEDGSWLATQLVNSNATPRTPKKVDPAEDRAALQP
jgi:outer membrane protein TolC